MVADKNHVAPRLSHVNMPSLNKLLRFEVFISEDGKLRAAHLILEYEPLSHIFQDAGQAIKARDSRLNCIDVSKLRFLAWKDLPPVELPIQHAPLQVVALGKESASSRHSLDAEIDHFYFEEAERTPRELVELSDFEHEFDRFSIAHPLRLVVTRVDSSSEIEEEGMDLKPRSSLRGLLSNRNKGSTSKEVPKTQVPLSLPFPPSIPPIDPRLKAIPNLKKKMPVEELEEGEVEP